MIYPHLHSLIVPYCTNITGLPPPPPRPHPSPAGEAASAAAVCRCAGLRQRCTVASSLEPRKEGPQGTAKKTDSYGVDMVHRWCIDGVYLVYVWKTIIKRYGLSY